MITGMSGPGTLLLIDDDHVVRNMLREVLESSGYAVMEAVDGEDGVDVFRNNMQSIHLIISDVVMPKKNGKQVYDEVRQLKQDVKILFMSGYPYDVIDHKMMRDNRMEFIPKPLRPNELLTKIKTILDS
jgi:two-component system cell cycle sensor histidine kinase/response regulator CckA